MVVDSSPKPVSQPMPTNPIPPTAPAPLQSYTEHAKQATDEWHTVTKKKKPTTIPTKSTLTHPVLTTNGPAWSLTRLSECSTTATMIHTHAKAIYGTKLSMRLCKAGLITAYQQLATNP